MVSDANAAFTDEIHAAALCAFYANFGDVLTVDECLRALAGGPSVTIKTQKWDKATGSP